MSSIPNSFDPIGLHEIEVPFIQPIMTSDSSWSNEPSFGMTLSPSQWLHWKAYYSFRQFEVLPSTYFCALLWAADLIPPLQIEISFEKPLKIKSISWHLVKKQFYSTTPIPDKVQLIANEKVLMEVDCDVVDAPVKYEILEPVYSTKYYLRVIKSNVASLKFPTNIVFDAVYKGG